MTGSQILIRLFKDSIKPYTVRLFSSLFFMVIIALATGATAWLLDPAIDKIFLDKDESMLLLIPIAIILTLFIKSVATYIQIILLNGVAQNIIADTQIKLFKKIINADLAWLHKIHSAKIISNFSPLISFNIFLEKKALINLIFFGYKFLKFFAGSTPVQLYPSSERNFNNERKST